MSQVIDEVTRLGAMAVEYRAAYSAGNPERLGIICQRIDEQYREQIPESGARPIKRVDLQWTWRIVAFTMRYTAA